MEATLTRQEAIARGLPKPSQCDLVVVLFWSRMGTPLLADYTKPDGTRYLSGTEWEFLDAVTEAKRSGRPAVWLYRRTEPQVVSLDDPQHDEKGRQWQTVKSFFQELVGQDGSLTGGVNHYKTPEEFRRQFEQHLRDCLTKVLEDLGPLTPEPSLQDRALTGGPRWTGTPYPGLEKFKPEQAPIFFGRGAEVDQLVKVLRDPEGRFIGIVGASGSGKSSLVTGGLIPRLRGRGLAGKHTLGRHHLQARGARRGPFPCACVSAQSGAWVNR